MQYSISNLNVFIILVTIGFSLYSFVNDNKEDKELLDKNNSPIQLISQLKGYFHINPMLSKAALKTICFAKNPSKGGIPAKEKIVIAKLKDNIGFI